MPSLVSKRKGRKQLSPPIDRSLSDQAVSLRPLRLQHDAVISFDRRAISHRMTNHWWLLIVDTKNGSSDWFSSRIFQRDSHALINQRAANPESCQTRALSVCDRPRLRIRYSNRHKRAGKSKWSNDIQNKSKSMKKRWCVSFFLWI